MMHHIEIDSRGTTFTITTAGQGNVEGIIAFLDAIVAHPQWRPGLNILLDHRRLDIAPITVEGIDRVSGYFQTLSPQLGDGKIALVMNRDIDFGIARAWELVTREYVDMEIGVFRSIEEARHWLAPSKDAAD